MRLQRRAEPRVHCEFDSPSPGQPITGRGTTSRSGERPSAEAAQSVPAKSWQAACVRHQRIRSIQRTHAAATTNHAPGGQLAWAHLQPLRAVDERANGTDGNGTVPFLSGQKWADRRNCPAGTSRRDWSGRRKRAAQTTRLSSRVLAEAFGPYKHDGLVSGCCAQCAHGHCLPTLSGCVKTPSSVHGASSAA